MGRGIAQVAALGGFETRLYDPIPRRWRPGAERLGEALAKGAARGRWSEDEAEAARSRVGRRRSSSELGRLRAGDRGGAGGRSS